MIEIRSVVVDDAEQVRTLRLYALQESPTAFGGAYEDEVARPLAYTAERLAQQQQVTNCIFGAFENGQLVGTIGFFQQQAQKMQHRSIIWGMFVHPDWRGTGLGRQLMKTAITNAKSLPDIKQIQLTVVDGNAAATKLYASLGFVSWGTEPRALKVDGIYYDEIHMVLYLD